MLGYLISPALQIENLDGKPLTGGIIRVYRHGTTIPYITWKDFTGDRNPADVVLDAKGMAVILAEPGNLYDIYCWDRNGFFQWSRLNVPVGSGGTGDAITSSDGSLVITQEGGTYDIRVANPDPTVWVSDENPGAAYQYLNVDGDFLLSEGSKSGTGLELVSGVLTVKEAGWYHVSVNWHVVKGGGVLGEYREVRLLVNGEETGANVDMSKARDPEYGSWSGDLELDAGDTIVFSTEGLDDDQKTAAYLDKVSVHSIAKGAGGGSGGGTEYSAGDGISIADDTISAKVDGTTIGVNASGELEALGGGGETYRAGNAISITDDIMHGDKVISVKLKTNGGLKFENSTMSPDRNSLEVKTDGYSIEVDPNSGALKTVMPVSPYWEAGQFLSVNSSGETEWVDVNIPENATVIDFHDDASTFPVRPMSDALDALLEKLRNGTASYPVYMRLPAFDGANLSAGARLLQLVEWEYESPWWKAEMKFSAPNRFYDNGAGTQRYGFEQLEMQLQQGGLEAIWHSNRHEFAAFTPTIITLQGV